MHKWRCNRRRKVWRAMAIVVIFLGTAASPGLAAAEGLLQLEVLVNGRPSGLIGSFKQNANGELSGKRKELEELHLRVPDSYGPEDEVSLASLPGVCRVLAVCPTPFAQYLYRLPVLRR